VSASCIVAVARCCGRIQFAAVEIPAKRDEIAAEVAELIKAGYRIETWELEKVRGAEWFCECPQQAVQVPNARGDRSAQDEPGV
jgi:hypothetical protein